MARSTPFWEKKNLSFVQKHEISPTKEGFGGWICLIFAKVLALDEIMTKQLRNEYLRKK